MKNENDSSREENISRLVLEAMCPMARPELGGRERVYLRLVTEVNKARMSLEFPEPVIMISVVILAVMALWSVLQITGLITRLNHELYLYIICAVLVLNLIFIPIASILIIRRRTYE